MSGIGHYESHKIEWSLDTQKNLNKIIDEAEDPSRFDPIFQF